MSMKSLGVVAGVRRVAVAGLVGDVGERPAHLALDRVGGQERLGVHRVEVVDAVQERRLEPRARSARRMTSRMTGPRRLPTWTVPDGVLLSLTTCGPLTGGELVGPVHGLAPARGPVPDGSPRRARSS